MMTLSLQVATSKAALRQTKPLLHLCMPYKVQISTPRLQAQKSRGSCLPMWPSPCLPDTLMRSHMGSLAYEACLTCKSCLSLRHAALGNIRRDAPHGVVSPCPPQGTSRLPL
jgi:hypothetical protein